jgi:carboxyl-terminal processing protease
LWALTDLALTNHLEPCTRQEMILAGMRAFYKAAGIEPPSDLARRVSELTTKEQVTEFIQQMWSKTADMGKPSVEVKDLEASLLEGALSCLAGDARILPADVLKGQEQLGGNRYVGTGIQIRMRKEDMLPQIVNPFRHGPIRRAGAKPGDLIVQVDGKETRNMALSKVVDWLRGEEGTQVTIVVRQPGTKETRTLNVVRGVVTIDTVLGYRRTGEETWEYRIDPTLPMGYVWVNALRSSTLHELRQVERQLRSEGVRALVLDLRFAAEGDLHHAELLADGLLDGGVMWRLHEAQNKTKECRADAECLFRGWPLAILLNGFTNGVGPDAVAAALQDNGRAVLVGEPLKGDGYVTTTVHLAEGGEAVVLRTGRLERAGTKHRGWPVKPDHVVSLKQNQLEVVSKWLRDKELPELPPGADDKPPDDPQLAKAVELLKAALSSVDQRKKD